MDIEKQTLKAIDKHIKELRRLIALTEDETHLYILKNILNSYGSEMIYFNESKIINEEEME